MSTWEQEYQNDGSGVGGPDTATGDAPRADYKVGYKRPPLQTRFKPGRSGNPKGRPKGKPNHRTTVNRVMNEKVSVREGGKTRRVTKFEAVFQAQANKGMKGDARSAGMVINVMSKTGLLGDQDDAIKINDPQTKPNLMEPTEPRLGDYLFEDINDSFLTDEEKMELARFAELLDARGFAGLSARHLERIKQLTNKGRGDDRAAA